MNDKGSFVARSFRTRTNSSVHARWDGSQPVVVKEAGDDNVVGSGRRELAEQVRHLRVVAAMLAAQGAASFRYPAVHSFDGRTAVLEYVGDETLAVLRQQDPAAAAEVTAAAVDGLFRPWDDASAPSGRDFPLRLVEGRVARLHEVAAALGDEEHWLRERLIGIASAVAAADTDRLAATAPPTLHVAWHGDFVADNVVVDPAGTPCFVDLRGRVQWHDGTPWWDPIFDLAAFAVFERGVPMLEDGAEPVASGTAAVRADVEALAQVAAASPAFRRWAEGDPHWRPRLELYVAVKLAGYLSIVAAYPDRRRHCARLLDCFEEVLEWTGLAAARR